METEPNKIVRLGKYEQPKMSKTHKTDQSRWCYTVMKSNITNKMVELIQTAMEYSPDMIGINEVSPKMS